MVNGTAAAERVNGHVSHPQARKLQKLVSPAARRRSQADVRRDALVELRRWAS